MSVGRYESGGCADHTQGTSDVHAGMCIALSEHRLETRNGRFRVRPNAPNRREGIFLASSLVPCTRRLNAGTAVLARGPIHDMAIADDARTRARIVQTTDQRRHDWLNRFVPKSWRIGRVDWHVRKTPVRQAPPCHKPKSLGSLCSPVFITRSGSCLIHWAAVLPLYKTGCARGP